MSSHANKLLKVTSNIVDSTNIAYHIMFTSGVRLMMPLLLLLLLLRLRLRRYHHHHHRLLSHHHRLLMVHHHRHKHPNHVPSHLVARSIANIAHLGVREYGSFLGILCRINNNLMSTPPPHSDDFLVRLTVRHYLGGMSSDNWGWNDVGLVRRGGNTAGEGGGRGRG